MASRITYGKRLRAESEFLKKAAFAIGFNGNNELFKLIDYETAARLFWFAVAVANETDPAEAFARHFGPPKPDIEVCHVCNGSGKCINDCEIEDWCRYCHGTGVLRDDIPTEGGPPCPSS